MVHQFSNWQPLVQGITERLKQPRKLYVPRLKHTPGSGFLESKLLGSSVGPAKAITIAQHGVICGEFDSPVLCCKPAAAACRSDRRKSDMAMRHEPHMFWIEFGLAHIAHRRILARFSS